MRKLIPALLLLTALGACQSEMTASAPSGALKTPGAPIAFVAVEGPQGDLARKFEGVLAQEAQRRGFSVVAGGDTGSALRVKTYLDAYKSEDGTPGFAWVMDTSDNGKTRSARIKGAAAMPSARGADWNALDEAAMRQIAQMSLNDLVRQMSEPAPASE